MKKLFGSGARDFDHEEVPERKLIKSKAANKFKNIVNTIAANDIYEDRNSITLSDVQSSDDEDFGYSGNSSINTVDQSSEINRLKKIIDQKDQQLKEKQQLINTQAKRVESLESELEDTYSQIEELEKELGKELSKKLLNVMEENDGIIPPAPSTQKKSTTTLSSQQQQQQSPLGSIFGSKMESQSHEIPNFEPVLMNFGVNKSVSPPPIPSRSRGAPPVPPRSRSQY